MAKVSKFHNQIAALALIAALILSVVPTISRIHESQQPAGWIEMCTTEGLKRLPNQELSAFIDGFSTKRQAHEGSCELCPLLSTLVFMALWLAFLAIAANGTPLLFTNIRATPASLRHLTGLGSRGPPQAFQAI
jgi:hypothetical protein